MNNDNQCYLCYIIYCMDIARVVNSKYQGFSKIIHTTHRTIYESGYLVS